MQIRLADRAYSDIVEIISERGLVVGDRLPAEAQLCDMLGVSRTVIREALTRLASDGFTESRRGAGSFVTRLPSKLLSQHMSASELSTTLGSYEVRFALEAEAARLAALRSSVKEMAEIEARLDALIAALQSNRDGDVEDMQLHRAIMIATGNKAFVLSFDALSSDVGRVMRAGIHISRARSPEAIQTMIQEHSAIVEAIRQRDPERAALSMRWHLSQGRMRLMP
jgi:GntR family transcriptional regulator, transcriptional repressor for pyruvate dehydrogenase complex